VLLHKQLKCNMARFAALVAILLAARCCGGSSSASRSKVGASSTSSDDAAPCSPATLDESALHAECPRDDSGGRCQAVVLRNVCLVQETIVLFDADAVDAHPDGQTDPLSGFDVTSVPYWYRHASPDRVDALVHASPHPHNHPSSVLGHQVNFPPVSSRYAAQHELDAAPPSFDACRLPVVLFTPWAMNFAESFIRVPTLLSKLSDAWSGAVATVATPLKLPADPFFGFYSAPFSEGRPTSFAELSALRVDGSDAANLTEHEACFDKVVLLKLKNGAYPELPASARRIADYYAPETPPSPWSTHGAAVTRVVFEQRPNKSMRQFLGLDDVLAECARDAALECKAHAFGASFTDDLALMKHADVLVSYHGAGEVNSLFMPPRSAILEVRARDFGTKHGFWSAFWWPAISQQTEQEVFFWGLNVEDTALNTNSAMEAEGLEHDESFNARDRFVTLQWRSLKLMLDKVIAVKRDVGAYRAIYKTHGTGVVWTWNNGSLTQAPPIFCSGDCPVLSSIQCKKC
jgi:hypothetical protein